MEKQKRWQLFVILVVIALTIYNILPTLFYYSKPLKKSIDEPRANEVALQICKRFNALESSSLSWVEALCTHLDLKPISVKPIHEDARLIEVSFNTPQEANTFRQFLPRAGALIPFVPAQLALSQSSDATAKTVLVERRVGISLSTNPDSLHQLFEFSSKLDENGRPTAFYRDLVYDRMAQLSTGLGGVSDSARLLKTALAMPVGEERDGLSISLAKKIVEFETTFGSTSPLAKRFYASFTQIDRQDHADLVHQLASFFENTKGRLASQIKTLEDEQQNLKNQGQFLSSAQQQQLELLTNYKGSLESASLVVRKNADLFQAGSNPVTAAFVTSTLEQSFAATPTSKILQFELGDRNPFFKALALDWENDKIFFKLHSDIQTLRSQNDSSETTAFLKERLNQFLINEVARVSRLTDETIAPSSGDFVVSLNQLTGSTSLLALNLGTVANLQATHLHNRLMTFWQPKSPDLSRSAFPILDYASYQTLPPEEQKLGLVIYAPSRSPEAPLEGFRANSLYVIAKGLNTIAKKYQSFPNSEESRLFAEDLTNLRNTLQDNGFLGYPGTAYGFASSFSNDIIFELDDYYNYLLKGTREDFSVHGSKHFATLEFTDVEQRILTLNKIETRMHEDLLKWRDEYQAAQVDLNQATKYSVPRPTQSVLWDNIKLSTVKYFRGDDRKILDWGLDLSGGKTVRIGLRDQNNQPVTDEADLRQGLNELYTRVNKMGVSEVSLRIEGSSIVLDFPGSQGLSATDLVKASAMYFHVANEKFTPRNTALATTVNEFLQDVWNEAVVTNRKDVEGVNEIAWNHLGGDIEEGNSSRPLSEASRILREQGLRIAGPQSHSISSSFNDTLSSVAIFRGEDFAEWQGQTHPLLVVFHNYALEGSNLENIHAEYSPAKGNVLVFGVKGSYTTKDGQRHTPREDFYLWTSQYCQEKILGTPNEQFSRGEGWRMAVILNGSIVNAPTLSTPLRNEAMITGHFSQREINNLASDLKAGSLSFTPRILSEQNVSPELGQEERSKGITAAFVGLVLVVVTMVGYYRFGGIVASIAVLFNLLIMWGVLQNLEAALTLPGIAGIVLTMGMAVDANVLVFERIREEFAISGRIASAIQAGYRKAFSAILDSNVTTIIAAFILLHFESGPIKAFAVTLIIGIISSMFTALFMTRYFFAGWVQNPEHKMLKMSHWIKNTKFDFLKWTKPAVIISLVLIVLGGSLFALKRQTIFGMDFTGGYALTVSLEEKPNTNYRASVADTLLSHGASSGEFQVRELNRPNNLRIQFGMSMEQEGHPFYQLPLEMNEAGLTLGYQKNPRINWVVNALKEGGLSIPQEELSGLENHWTVMSGQFSESMRNNAALGLGLALICILIYITFRFEFKYAISAIIALTHDVLITLGVLAILHQFGVSIQIDLQVVGAIMTIVGYSLNDTIIVFDRIREDARLLRKLKFGEMINHALNVTLSRTLMTSGTTLLVLLALVCLGGSSIFDFSLVMTIGVVFGTLSSLFIASPLLLYFHNREANNEKEVAMVPKKI